MALCYPHYWKILENMCSATRILVNSCFTIDPPCPSWTRFWSNYRRSTRKTVGRSQVCWQQATHLGHDPLQQTAPEMEKIWPEDPLDHNTWRFPRTRGKCGQVYLCWKLRRKFWQHVMQLVFQSLGSSLGCLRERTTGRSTFCPSYAGIHWHLWPESKRVLEILEMLVLDSTHCTVV